MKDFLKIKPALLFGLCAVLALWSAMYALTYAKSIRIDDDNMYFYYTSYAVTHPGEHKRLWGALSKEVQAFNDSNEVARDNINRNYIDNYLMNSLAWSLANAIYTPFKHIDGKPASEGPLQFHDITVPIGLGSFILGFAGIVLAFLSGNTALRSTFLLAIPVLFLLSCYGFSHHIDRLTVGHEGQCFRYLLKRTIYFVLYSPMHFNIFSFEARGVFAVWIMTLFILRWRNMNTASYWLLLPLVFLHRTNAGLLIMMLVAIDTIYQPKNLFNRHAALPLAIATSLVVFLDPLLAVANYTSLVVVVVFIALTLFIARTIWSRHIEKYLQHKIFADPVFKNGLIDIVFFWSAWFISLVALYYVWDMGLIDKTSGRYSWFQLHTRIGVMMLAPTVIMTLYGIFYVLNINLVTKAVQSVLIAATVLVIGYGTMQAVRSDNIWTLSADIRGNTYHDRKKSSEELLTDIARKSHDWAAGKPLPYIEENETIWYYGLITGMQGIDGYFFPATQK